MTDLKDVQLSPVARTLLIPLAFRAAESQRPDSILHDEQALELARRLGPDCLPQINQKDMDYTATLMRARQFDRFGRNFLEACPAGMVVDVGCGLDTRFGRIDNGLMCWVGVDLPEVIELRRSLLPEMPRTCLIGRSALDFAWMDEVTPPAIFLAEGLLVYFFEEDVRRLVLELRRRFPGCELVFDALSRGSIRIHRLLSHNTEMRAAALQVHWGLDESDGLEAWGPDIKLLEEWRYFDHAEPRLSRYNWMRHIRFLARANVVLRYRLGRYTKGDL